MNWFDEEWSGCLSEEAGPLKPDRLAENIASNIPVTDDLLKNETRQTDFKNQIVIICSISIYH